MSKALKACPAGSKRNMKSKSKRCRKTCKSQGMVRLKSTGRCVKPCWSGAKRYKFYTKKGVRRSCLSPHSPLLKFLKHKRKGSKIIACSVGKSGKLRILNVASGKCVNKTGAIGKFIQHQMAHRSIRKHLKKSKSRKLSKKSKKRSSKRRKTSVGYKSVKKVVMGLRSKYAKKK